MQVQTEPRKRKVEHNLIFFQTAVSSLVSGSFVFVIWWGILFFSTENISPDSISPLGRIFQGGFIGIILLSIIRIFIGIKLFKSLYPSILSSLISLSIYILYAHTYFFSYGYKSIPSGDRYIYHNDFIDNSSWFFSIYFIVGIIVDHIILAVLKKNKEIKSEGLIFNMTNIYPLLWVVLAMAFLSLQAYYPSEYAKVFRINYCFGICPGL